MEVDLQKRGVYLLGPPQNLYQKSPNKYMKPTPPKLIVFSGIPGVGKSRLSFKLAEKMGIAILTKDQVERTLIESKLVQDTARVAYDVMIQTAEFNLHHGVSIILDAVWGTNNLRKHLKTITTEMSAELYIIECICSDEGLWKKRVGSREEMVKGWDPAGWDEVERVKEYYESWEMPHLTLDSVNNFEENYKSLLEYLKI
jgi:predicted kinase